MSQQSQSFAFTKQFIILWFRHFPCSSADNLPKEGKQCLYSYECLCSEKHGNLMPLSSTDLIKPVTCCLSQSEGTQWKFIL